VREVERTIIAGFLFVAGGGSRIFAEGWSILSSAVMIREGELRRKIDEINGRITSEDEIPAFEGICILSEERSLGCFTCTGTIKFLVQQDMRDSIILVIRAFRSDL
jgi:hypothetical protein